jgi:SPP1 gp7 family putative phage head morphogenesis protein
VPAIAADSYNATLRHQVFVERLKKGEVKKALPFLRQMDASIRARLSGDELTVFQRTRLETLLREIEGLLFAILYDYTAQLSRDLEQFAYTESVFEARSLTNAVRNPLFEATIPAPAQIAAAIFSNPLSVRGASGGLLLKPFFDGFTKRQVDSVVGRIRQGVFEGQTNSEIVQAIRGTKAARYENGLLAVTKRQAEAMVRTAIQHVSSTARMETFKENGDLVRKYRWVSTLDDRTTPICQSLDGQEFNVGEGPMPPAHINCRSSTVAILDERFKFLQQGATRSSLFGYVDRNETYFGWLKNQSAEFQDAALGPVRGKLLRDGGLSSERFRRIVTSKDYQPLTLTEMKSLEPLAFQRAGIELDPNTGRVINW